MPSSQGLVGACWVSLFSFVRCSGGECCPSTNECFQIALRLTWGTRQCPGGGGLGDWGVPEPVEGQEVRAHASGLRAKGRASSELKATSVTMIPKNTLADSLPVDPQCCWQVSVLPLSCLSGQCFRAPFRIVFLNYLFNEVLLPLCVCTCVCTDVGAIEYPWRLEDNFAGSILSSSLDVGFRRLNSGRQACVAGSFNH